MKTKFTHNSFNAKRHLAILKTFLFTANLVVLFIYGYMRLAFYDLPFSVLEELPVVGNLMAWASLFAASLSFILFAAHGLAWLYLHRKQVKFTAIRVTEVSSN